MSNLKVTKLTLFQDSYTNRLQLRTSSFTIGNQFDNNTIHIQLERLDKFPSYPAYLIIQPDDCKPFTPIQFTSGNLTLSNLFTQTTSLTVQVMLKRNYDAIYSDSLKLKLTPALVNNSPIDIDGLYNKPICIERSSHIVTKEELKLPFDFPVWDHTGNCPVCGKPACPYDPTNPDNADKQPSEPEPITPPVDDTQTPSDEENKPGINPGDIVYPSITDPVVASISFKSLARSVDNESLDGGDTSTEPTDTSTTDPVSPDTSDVPPTDTTDNTDTGTSTGDNTSTVNPDNTDNPIDNPPVDNTDSNPPVENPPSETPVVKPSVPSTPLIPATPIKPLFDVHIETPSYLVNNNHILVFLNGSLLEQSKYTEAGNSISNYILISSELLNPGDRLDFISFG